MLFASYIEASPFPSVKLHHCTSSAFIIAHLRYATGLVLCKTETQQHCYYSAVLPCCMIDYVHAKSASCWLLQALTDTSVVCLVMLDLDSHSYVVGLLLLAAATFPIVSQFPAGVVCLMRLTHSKGLAPAIENLKQW